MFFMGAAFEIEECRVALIFELLVDADRGAVVPVDGGFLNGKKKSLFEPSEAFFVLADLLQQCHLLIRGTFRSAILSRAVRPRVQNLFVLSFESAMISSMNS